MPPPGQVRHRLAVAPALDPVQLLDHALDPLVEALVRFRQCLGGRRGLLGSVERRVVIESVVVRGIELSVAGLTGHETASRMARSSFSCSS